MRAQLFEASLKRLVAAVELAESNRGCFSCTGAHDIRCTCDRGECCCGRDELDAAIKEAKLVQDRRQSNQKVERCDELDAAIKEAKLVQDRRQSNQEVKR